MERAAAGQAALRYPSPAAAPAAVTAKHRITPRVASRITPGNRFTAPPRAAALSRALGGRILHVTGHENGLLLRRTCLTVAAPPRKAPTPSGDVRLGSKR